MRKSKSGPEWFKLHKVLASVARAVGREAAGAGLIAALDHFTGREPQELTRDALIIYEMLCEWIDEAESEYAARAEDGRRGAAARWGSPPIAPLNPSLGGYAEAEEIQNRTEEESEKESDRAEQKAPRIVADLLSVSEREHIGMTRSEIEEFVEDMEYSDWTVNGEPIRSMGAVMRAWKQSREDNYYDE